MNRPIDWPFLFRLRRGDRTQDEIAQLLGCSQPTIARIEAGKSVPSVVLWERLARADLGARLPLQRADGDRIVRCPECGELDTRITFDSNGPGAALCAHGHPFYVWPDGRPS